MLERVFGNVGLTAVVMAWLGGIGLMGALGVTISLWDAATVGDQEVYWAQQDLRVCYETEGCDSAAMKSTLEQARQQQSKDRDQHIQRASVLSAIPAGAGILLLGWTGLHRHICTCFHNERRTAPANEDADGVVA